MKLKKHLLVTILVGLAVFVIAFAATAALAGPPEPQVPPPGSERIQLADEDFDGWRYTAYREEKNVVLQITLEDTSPEGLESFRTVNRQMARDLVRQQEMLKVSVVLNQPLSLAEFTELVEKYGLHVYGFQVRIIDGRGDRVTLFGSSDGDQLVRKDLLQTMLERVQDQTGEATLLAACRRENCDSIIAIEKVMGISAITQNSNTCDDYITCKQGLHVHKTVRE